MIIGMDTERESRDQIEQEIRASAKRLEEKIATYLSDERLWERLQACYYEALGRVPTQPGSSSMAGVSDLEWIESHLCPPAPAEEKN